MAAKKRGQARSARPKRTARTPPKAPSKFVGRDASPVLERYPPRPNAPAPPPPLRQAPARSLPAAPATAPPPAAGSTPSPSSGPLIRLERPFDVDDFSTLLGETSVKVNVPRESLTEVLRRVTDFMGFGIYVYSVNIRPAPTELLKEFVVELQRVDFSAEKKAWLPFVDKGASESPFGPSGTPT
ncbi:MAG: hypothetical protein ACLP74_07145 [Thermoplasmata archaeon]